MFCKYCGNELSENMKFCTKCGKPVGNAQETPSNRRGTKQKVVVPLATPGQAQTVRPEPAEKNADPPVEKKKNGAVIALIVVVAVLVIAVVVLAIVFFGGNSGGSDNGKSGNTAIEESDDKDDEDDEDDEDDKKGDGSDIKDQEDTDQEDKSEGKDTEQTDNDPTSNTEDADELLGEDPKAAMAQPDEQITADDEDDDAIFHGDDADYILPDSSTRRLTDEDLADIADDAWLLRLARNEIYARHHRLFDSEELREYFESKDWYDGYIEPDSVSDEDMLSQIEKDNIKLIKKYEAKLK